MGERGRGKEVKHRADIALFLVVVVVLGGTSGAALSQALGGSLFWIVVGAVAGLMLGSAYAARMQSRRKP
jgi:uncharacterized membrane protein YfcA